MFAELKGRDARSMNESLQRIGFRRSQNVVYRPSCDDCRACVPIRVEAMRFKPSASQKRLLKTHADLEVHACEPWSTEEQWALMKRYLAARHPQGGMAAMDGHDYADMVEQSPVDTLIIEYREPSTRGRLGRLVGCCITDQQSDGLSMIYSFFDCDPDARQGLGNFIILDHITRAAKAGLPYVYLGYYVEGCARMTYKTRFQPAEALRAGNWRGME